MSSTTLSIMGFLDISWIEGGIVWLKECDTTSFYKYRLKKKKKKLIRGLAQLSFFHFSSSFTQFFLFLVLSLVAEFLQSPPILFDFTSHKLAAWAASCNFAGNVAISSLLFLSQSFRVTSKKGFPSF